MRAMFLPVLACDLCGDDVVAPVTLCTRCDLRLRRHAAHPLGEPVPAERAPRLTPGCGAPDYPGSGNPGAGGFSGTGA